MEKAAFEKLMKDPLKHFVPLYFKAVSMHDENAAPVEYLCMQDLLAHFDNPSVMDVKMVSEGRKEQREKERTKRRKGTPGERPSS